MVTVLLRPDGRLPIGMNEPPKGAILVWPSDPRNIEVPANHVLQELEPKLIGDKWVQQWTAVPASTETEEVITVSMAQARLALRRAGLLNSVQAAISSIVDEDERSEAEIYWEYSTVVSSNHPLVFRLQTIFGLTPTQIKELFDLAKQF